MKKTKESVMKEGQAIKGAAELELPEKKVNKI